jgi:alkanesulfonate monooxygenase SsuD/methylene tetrahydromethanopterin reductase-like flavin-dependent oxidoreductase (luciferase family)
MGTDFRTRGARTAEQVRVLRALWTQEVVTFHGRWHHIEEAGINPLPVQRPIPIWMGGGAEVVLRRIARLGDGWFAPGRRSPDDLRPLIERLRRYTERAGRDHKDVGIEPRIAVTDGGPDEWRLAAETWRALGATHLTVSTLGARLGPPDAHIKAISRARDALRT